MRYPLPWFLLSDNPSRCSCQTKPGCRFIGHLSWNADLIAVEVVSLLAAFDFFVGPVVYLCQRFVAVGPSFFCTVFFEDFRFNQLVMQVVEIVLYFAVGEFAVDQVAEVVVVIGLAVVGFQAVVGDGRAIVIGQDIVRGVEVACTFSGNSKRLRSFEQKPRACVPHTPYVKTESFVRATACYSDSRKLVIKTSILSINLIGTITVYSKFSSNELLKSYIAS